MDHTRQTSFKACLSIAVEALANAMLIQHQHHEEQQAAMSVSVCCTGQCGTCIINAQCDGNQPPTFRYSRH